MKINFTEETNRNIKKSRFSKTESKTNCVTDADTEIGNRAYFSLGQKKSDDMAQIEISRSAVLSGTMVQLEKMLEKLHKQPKTDLLALNPRGGRYSEPFELSEWRFKEGFLLGLRNFVRVTKDLPAECRFSPAIEVFIECCREFPLEESIQITDGFRLRDKSFFWPQICCVNNFYRELMRRLSNPLLRKKIREYNWQFEINSREFQSYVDSLFQVYARLVVLRLDLEYCAEHKPSLSGAMSDINRFFSNRHHNKIFNALCGFVCKVEFGIFNGYHFHLLLFFDGSKRSNCSDSYLAKQIGEYWKIVITKGKGRYWNANGDKANYAKNRRLGIGAIHASELFYIENLKGIIRYFCKKEQFFRPVNQPKFRTIRKGGGLISGGKKLGRPRVARVVI